MTDPWQQIKHDTYLAFYLAAVQIYELPVWAVAGDRPADTAGPTVELAALARRLAFDAPAPVAAAAAGVRSAAGAFTAVIDNLRVNSMRPPNGRLYGDAQQRYDRAQREIGANIDQFATLARADLGITGDYLRLAPVQNG